MLARETKGEDRTFLATRQPSSSLSMQARWLGLRLEDDCRPQLAACLAGIQPPPAGGMAGEPREG